MVKPYGFIGKFHRFMAIFGRHRPNSGHKTSLKSIEKSLIYEVLPLFGPFGLEFGQEIR